VHKNNTVSSPSLLVAVPFAARPLRHRPLRQRSSSSPPAAAAATTAAATAAVINDDNDATMTTRSVLWFRKGLRLHDNPALVRACEGAAAVQPIFVLDPWFLAPERVGANRLRFLLESLHDLDASLRLQGGAAQVESS
jgi:hypothetical protein